MNIFFVITLITMVFLIDYIGKRLSGQLSENNRLLIDIKNRLEKNCEVNEIVIRDAVKTLKEK